MIRITTYPARGRAMLPLPELVAGAAPARDGLRSIFQTITLENGAHMTVGTEPRFILDTAGTLRLMRFSELAITEPDLAAMATLRILQAHGIQEIAANTIRWLVSRCSEPGEDFIFHVHYLPGCLLITQENLPELIVSGAEFGDDPEDIFETTAIVTGPASTAHDLIARRADAGPALALLKDIARIESGFDDEIFVPHFIDAGESRGIES